MLIRKTNINLFHKLEWSSFLETCHAILNILVPIFILPIVPYLTASMLMLYFLDASLKSWVWFLRPFFLFLKISFWFISCKLGIIWNLYTWIFSEFGWKIIVEKNKKMKRIAFLYIFLKCISSVSLSPFYLKISLYILETVSITVMLNY